MNAERARYWKATVVKWKASGLSMKTFCEREGLVLGTMSRWNWQLKRANGQRLVELGADQAMRATPASHDVCIEVVAGGYVVRVRPGTQADDLRLVLEVLESRP